MRAVVADQRNPLLGQGGEHQLAGHAVAHGLQGLRVHDLRQEMILVHMQPAVQVAVRGHAWAHDLAEAVDIVGLDAQLLLDLVPHLLRPRLRAV